MQTLFQLHNLSDAHRPIDIVQNLVAVRDAATEFLKLGEHEGPCDDFQEGGHCMKHYRALEAREDALRTALDKVK